MNFMAKPLLTFLSLGTLIFFVTGCTDERISQANVSQLESNQYEKKAAILDQVEQPLTPVGIMTNILTSEWPTLFSQKMKQSCSIDMPF